MRMTMRAVLAGAALLAMASTAAAQETAAEFRRLRGEVARLATLGNLEAAADLAAQADALVPNHPAMILNRARLATGMGDPTEGVRHLRRYADAGLVVDIPDGSPLSALAGTRGYDAALARIESNRQPVGAARLGVVARLPGMNLTESVAWDPVHRRWLVSQIAGRTILSVGGDGSTTPWLAEVPQTGGLLGLAVDARRGWVWVASAPLPPAVKTAEGWTLPRSALLRVELATGRINAWFEAPNDGADHLFGDIALGPDGTVYVADSTGAILHLRPEAESTLETLLAPGALASPQGMTVTPDGKALIAADYSTGLHRIDLATGVTIRMEAPADASLIGVDGLTRDGTALYVIQNGVAPQRVLRLTLDPGWTAIERVEVIAANLPEIDEPTTGLVHDGGLVFVSRSQWSDFDDDGAPKPGADGPAIIARLRLD